MAAAAVPCLCAKSYVNHWRNSSFLPVVFWSNKARTITKLKSSVDVVRVQATATLTTEAPRVSRIEKWQETKRIQTQSAVIAPETKVIRSLDWDRDRFDMYVTCPTPISLSLSLSLLHL